MEPKITAFEVSFDDSSKAPGASASLQDAFIQYRKKKQDDLRAKMLSTQVNKAEQGDPVRMESLRQKFLTTCLEYIGVPYAKRYHEPDSPTHHAKLFLDCCGLVRKALRDLQEDFGFVIGPWNQSYMVDTLPIVLSGPDQMKPGDLVFVSGTFHNPKAKKQRHDMVHVEVWIGDGIKTLGARWQKGRVEIHDSYQFESKSYHSMQYYFRSIDTWLAGDCKSICSEHAWTVRKFDPSKHSVFALQEQEVFEEAYSLVQQDDTPVLLDDQDTTALLDDKDRSQEDAKDMIQDAKGTPHHDNDTNPDVVIEEQDCPHLEGPDRLEADKLKSVSKKNMKVQKSKLARTFVICGGNARVLVEEVLASKGWVMLEDDKSLHFNLKWVELKTHIDYKNFRSGEQLVNHIPNINLLTTKIGLLESLRSYCRIRRPQIKMDNFVPLTYRLDVQSEREEFFKNYNIGDLWICKPTSANQGKGIFIVRELSQLTTRLDSDKKNCKLTSKPTARIVQRYISEPLLLSGKKFDIRVYMFIQSARPAPWVVLYRDGYVRLCCEKYQADSESLAVHLTNQYQQRKHPLYSDLKDDTVWDFERLQECVTAELGLPGTWVKTTLTRRMITIMSNCFNSVKHKLSHADGYFELLGFDFMLDKDLNVWLIEANINPALHTNCNTLAQICPSVVQETLDISIEVFDKCRRNRPLRPISSLKHFRHLH